LSFYVKAIDWSLYAIVDQEWLNDRSIESVAEGMIRGGAGVIQYRDKTSDKETVYESVVKLRQITHTHSVPFIINDYVDIAIDAKADGVHLGQEDLDMDQARKFSKGKLIIGGSVSSLSEFEKVKDADYFGIGSVYPTKTKSDTERGGVDLIRQIRPLTDRPLIGIGGITVQNLAPVIRAGCDGIAVISAIMSCDDIEHAVRELVHRIKEVKSQIDTSI
jgi:thiamine-phosphate pyrophosphorylase